MELFGINFIQWLAIFAGISLFTSLIVIRHTTITEDFNCDEVNWMNMEAYDKQLIEATKVDETKLHIVPLTEDEIDTLLAIDNSLSSNTKRDKSGKFVKKTTILPTDYYSAKAFKAIDE